MPYASVISCFEPEKHKGALRERWHTVIGRMNACEIRRCLCVSWADGAADDEHLVLQPFDRDLALVPDARKFPVEDVGRVRFVHVKSGSCKAAVGARAVIFIVWVDSILK